MSNNIIDSSNIATHFNATPWQSKPSESHKTSGASDSTTGYGSNPMIGGMSWILNAFGNIGEGLLGQLLGADLGMKLDQALTTALDNLLSTFMSYISSGGTDLQPFVDAYGTIYDWTLTTSQNPLVNAIDEIGGALGWSSTQEQTAIDNVTTGITNKVLDPIDNILNTLMEPAMQAMSLNSSTFTDILQQAVTGGLNYEYPIGYTTGDYLESMGQYLDTALQDPLEYPGAQAAFESAMTDFSQMLGEVSSLMSSMLIPQIDMDMGQLESLFKMAQALQQMECQAYQSMEANMPGYSG